MSNHSPRTDDQIALDPNTYPTPQQAGDELARLRQHASLNFHATDWNRIDFLRDHLSSIDANGRYAALTAAIGRLDPDDALGPYTFKGEAILTAEQLAFEEWRLSRLYARDEDEDSIPGMILWMMDPLVAALSETEKTAHLLTQIELGNGSISAENFPGYDVLRELRKRDPETRLRPISEVVAVVESRFDPGLHPQSP